MEKLAHKNEVWKKLMQLQNHSEPGQWAEKITDVPTFLKRKFQTQWNLGEILTPQSV